LKRVFSVYDTKAKLWSTPFFAHSAVVAVRDFSAAARGNSSIAQFPEDYELWSIGSWDEETGVFTPETFTYHALGNDFTAEVR